MRLNLLALCRVLNISYVIVLIITKLAVGKSVSSHSSSSKNVFSSAGRHAQLLNTLKSFSSKEDNLFKGKNYDVDDAQLSTSKSKPRMMNWSPSQGLSHRGGSASHTYPYGIGIIEKLRIALAGGIAGATGTAILYPIDTAKTYASHLFCFP